MAYNTGNPIGSTSPKDLSDNARNLDMLVLGPDPSYLDRKGVPRKSWKGMEGEHDADQIRREAEFDADQTRRESEFDADQGRRESEHDEDQARRESEFDAAQEYREDQFNERMDASGYEPPIPYAPGILLDRTTKTVSYLGNEYRAKSSFIPMTTSSWATDEAKLKLIGDDSLRQQLADPAVGASNVAGTSRNVDSLAALTFPGRYNGDTVKLLSYYAGWAATTIGATGAGDLYWSSTSTATADGGYAYAVSGVSVGRWLRLDVVDVLDYGGMGDDVFDNYAATVNYMKYAFSRDTVRKVKFPAGRFRFSQPLIFDSLPFTLVQYEHRFAFEGAGVEMTRLTFSSGTRLIGWDFQTIGGLQTDIRRFDVSGFTITDTRYAGGISFSPATALSFIGAPDSRFKDIFVIGCNEGFFGQAVFGTHITNIKTKYTRRGLTFLGDAVAGFSNTDTVSPISMFRCEIMGSAANITDGWGLKVMNAISFHCNECRFENWINVPSIWFEGVRGSSITKPYIEGSYATHAIRLNGRGTMDNERDITRAIDITSPRFYDSLGIVFFPGVSNVNVKDSYFHLGLSSPITDKTSNIHVAGVSGQLGVVLHDIDIDNSNVFTSELEPAEMIADARFGMFSRNGVYYGRKSTVDGTWSAFYPTTLSAGKTILPSNFAADGAFMGVVERGGTKGTISATATTTSGSNTVTVSNVADLYPTTFISISGAIVRACVLSINRSTGVVILDANCTASVSGAALTYEPPVIRRLL
ncbi:hypothetical protein ACQKDL_12815 [Pseudomonas bubulae]|uniref:hypothetical protein n=1 Tax=Pseudomonas bubulae TaxID=2316085 RepID=UPI003CFF9536